MKKSLKYLDYSQKIKSIKIGDCVLGFVITFNKNYTFVTIGYHKIFIVFDNSETFLRKKNWVLFFKIENKIIQNIRENIKNNKNIYQSIYHGYFGFLNLGKIYRLTINMSINLIKNFKKYRKLKIVSKKYEYEFALGSNGFIWINSLYPLNILLFLEYILNNQPLMSL
jgi:exosome complex RNA-binding protein Rrp4